MTTPAQVAASSFQFAGRRDASWYRSPGWAAMYHCTDNGQTACCDQWMPMSYDTVIIADTVPVRQRCQRAACRKRWPA